MSIAALAAAFLLAVTGPYLQHWEAANHQTIARVHSAKERDARRRTFAQTQHALSRLQAQHVVQAADARRVVETILADHKTFRLHTATQKPAPQSWFDRLTAWLGERWRALMDALFGRVKFSSGAGVAIGDVFLLLAMLGFVLLVGRIIVRYAGRSSINDGAHSVDLTQDPGTLFSRACREAEEERYRVAITTVFAAAVCLLDRRGLLRGVPSETVGQLRRAVSSSSNAAAEPFATLCALLTQTIYADEQAGPQDWARAQSAYEQLRRSEVRTDAA
ncbi:MAG: DUF4129 domain-containing protein [Candidatus Eremiobacteraeota bacterium]|nr:DUF4129 domain-containing protein [Candidatus Eremiobacteraeota bacterium]